jgi:proteasome lid subunit RPN8/RPN11
MNEESERLVLAASAEAEPREACGLVWHDRAFVVPNIAHKGTTFFIMDSREVMRLYTLMSHPATGVWHSHPGGTEEPSESDLEYHPPGMRMYIVANGKVHDHGIQG